ncbi:Putative multidrug export ATP-binding/permease protein SAV1866 [uncultured Clostridium sp.]|uniref:ABC transporter ATP-binding protein n=1 Tax=Enterocloster citroniae TaxID=358743 RepID=UPI000820CEF3|nr:ABC transporter ATP-binding protein [Enterocloster citroniae]MCB7062590.1 ABC transporter ATP-binding protein/permease [Enterocloster citroniae]SCI61990.1 Putative multidrug export ATP-binding/permease protein SAV1866 [uncultured Clostridium sp.]
MKNITKPKYRKLHLIIQFLQGSKVYFAAAVAASLISTILNALTPQIFRFSIDEVLSGNGGTYLSGHLWILAMMIVAVAVASGIFTYISRTNTAKAGENFAKNLRDALFIHVQKLPMKWHDRNQTGDIIQRCTSDVEVIRGFVVTQLLEVFRTAFLVIISFVMMFSMNVKLSCIVLLFVPVVIVYSTVFYRLIAKRFTTADEAEGELSTVVQENATGVRVVRAFGREQFEMERFDKKNNAFASLWIRLGTLSGLYWGIGDLITGLQVVAVIIFGVMEAVNGFISVGEFIAFAAYNSTLVWPIRGLGRILSDMSKAGVSFERVDYIIRSQEEAYGKRAEIYGKGNVGFGEENETSPKTYDISFQHVSFGYEDGKDVLKDISFTIPEGRTFGVLGGTGSGKSTVVQLLSRLYELKDSRGSICIGGREIRDIPIEELRRNIGTVLQEPFLYSRTIRENISASVPDASMEEIRYAAQIACIDDAIMSFPDGYDTLVGERGVTLSGGQKQRIAIARMLLQKAPIMVFDDSLSAVDSQTDYHIRCALKEHMREATVILISHRVTSLMGADEIMVLNQGQIEECGTHGELIRKNGIYRKIYDIQMSRDDREKMEG